MLSEGTILLLAVEDCLGFVSYVKLMLSNKWDHNVKHNKYLMDKLSTTSQIN